MKFICILILTFFSTTGFATQVTNAREGVWSDISLWSGGILPASNDTVSLNYDIVIDINAVCKVLYANGHTVTINAGFDLSVSGVAPLADSTFTDSRDGKVYTFRHIGSQVWMTQNLNYEAPGSLCYYNADSNCAVYGRLYRWDSALIVVPAGWHLPDNPEWDTLINFLGGEAVAGGCMKQAGITYWGSPNTGATNSSGFNALPGGLAVPFLDTINFNNRKWEADWWTSTESDRYQGGRIELMYTSGAIYSRVPLDKNWYLSVRCVRD